MINKPFIIWFLLWEPRIETVWIEFNFIFWLNIFCYLTRKGNIISRNKRYIFLNILIFIGLKRSFYFLTNRLVNWIVYTFLLKQWIATHLHSVRRPFAGNQYLFVKYHHNFFLSYLMWMISCSKCCSMRLLECRYQLLDRIRFSVEQSIWESNRKWWKRFS